jgi:hypothetical protein
VEPAQARAAWHRLETINAVAYFTDECRRAPEDLGLVGFWMGYFACRAAPMGPVGPGVVEATFANFHPDRVRRAIPDAWSRAAPAAVVDARSTATAAALRRLLGADAAEELAPAVLPSLQAVVAAADGTGRPLFTANRDVPLPADPVAALWHSATTLREHRGDAHVALLVAEGLSGLAAHVLFAAGTGVDRELYLQSRGWSDADWDAAADGLRGRGLVDGAGLCTSTGRALRDRIEHRTDELAAEPFATLAAPAVDALLSALAPAAAAIVASGEIRYPNPMGLPATDA